MTRADYLWLGVAGVIVGYSIPQTRNVTVLVTIIIIVGLLLRFQGTILHQLSGLFPAKTAKGG